MSNLPAYRPVVLIGQGYRLAGKTKRWECPTLLTWRAADLIPEDDPYNFGRPGAICQKYANLILQNASHLEIVGARVDLPQCGFNPAGMAPNAIRTRIPAIPCEDWLSVCRGWKAKYPVVTPEHWAQTEYVNPYAFIQALSDAMEPGDVIVPSSSGMASEISMQSLQFKCEQRVIFSPGLGAMGFAIPQAIGAHLASGRRVIVIEGDGSLQLNAQELEVISRHNMNIKIFVWDNGGYGTIRNSQTARFNRVFGADKASGLTIPDVVELADNYGILASYYYRTNKDLSELPRMLSLNNEPRISTVSISPNQTVSPRIKSTMVDGKIIPGRLEDV